MKIYKGQKTGLGPFMVWVVDPGEIKASYRLRHIERHSSDGFNWGYGGSGPADLALSILVDFAGWDFAEKNYQRFKSDIVAKAGQELMICDSMIEDWLYETMKKVLKKF